jgi:hypothetical protein
VITIHEFRRIELRVGQVVDPASSSAAICSWL